MKINIISKIYACRLQHIKGLLAIAIMLIISGCEKFIETDPPHSQVSSAVVFEDSKTANAAMAGIYINMRDGGLLNGSSNGINYKLGLYADELDSYALSAGVNNFHSNSLFAAHTGVLDTWTKSYNQIYAINSVIEGVNASSSLNLQDKNQLLGEALFLRGLLHFYLMNLFGEVPYVTSTDYVTNSSIGKISLKRITESLISDLKQSILLLPENYSNSLRIRPNRFSSYALLARVLLYDKQWKEASEVASIVINNNQYSLPSDLSKVFLKESTETIWQLQSNGAGNNTIEATLFIFTSGPPTNVALTKSLAEAFEAGDLRYSGWTKTITSGTNKWTHSFKYKERANTTISKEFSIVLRLAEQYLIRAEAKTMQADFVGALKDLNAIRKRAGLQDAVYTNDKDLIDAIERERRVELFSEFGHRFFDLKRYGNIDAVLKTSKPGWDTNDSLWPLPSVELSINPNLNPQNVGY